MADRQDQNRDQGTQRQQQQQQGMGQGQQAQQGQQQQGEQRQGMTQQGAREDQLGRQPQQQQAGQGMSQQGMRQQGGQQGQSGQQQQFDSSGGGQMGGGGSFTGQIREHQEVVDASGKHIGTVDHVQGDRIKLARSDSSDGEHHYVMLSQVQGIEGGKVCLRERGDTDFGMESGGR